MEQIKAWSVTETPTVREQTIEVLRDALMNNVFRPGEKLVERALAEKTGVSRTSLREALGQLEAEGLVTKVGGKGIFVTKLSEAEALQIYEARAVLEAALARLFVERADQERIIALERALAEAKSTNSRSDAQLHAQNLDLVSHIIMEGAGNDVMRQMASVLRTRVTFLRTITTRAAPNERRQETMKLLTEIVHAFRERDADMAEHLTREYVQRSAHYALEILAATDAGQTDCPSTADGTST